jgi:WD40 repeat protein
VPVYEAFGKTARGQGAEICVYANGSLYSVAVSIPLRDAPKAALDAIARESQTDRQLDGFKPNEARTFRLQSIEPEDYYQFFGDSKEGTALEVRVGADLQVKTFADTREVLREEAGISPSAPRPNQTVATQGFSVLAARYGRGDRWVDISETVREAATAELREFPTTNLPDAAYGSRKCTVMAYAVDGKVGLAHADEFEPLTLDARQDPSSLAEVPSRGFAVLAARYGVEDHWEDVTDAVRSRVKDGRLKLKPADAKFPDPAPTIDVKMLAVAYASNGKVGLYVNHQGRTVDLPPDIPPVNSESLLLRSIEFPRNPSIVSFTTDGRQVVVGVEDGSVRMLDATSGREVHRFDGHGPGWVPVAVSSNAMIVASGGEDKIVRVWDVRTEREKAVMRGHTAGVFRVALSPNGRVVASTSRDKTVRIWDIATGTESHKLEGHAEFVNGLKFTPDGRQLVTASWDQSVRLWDVATGREVRKRQETNINALGDLSLSRDGRQIYYGAKDGSFRVWEPSSKKDPFVFYTDTESEAAVAPTPDGRRVLIGDMSAASVWDCRTGRPFFRLERHLSRVSSVALSPDGRKAATTSEDRTLKLWKIPDLGK